MIRMYTDICKYLQFLQNSYVVRVRSSHVNTNCESQEAFTTVFMQKIKVACTIPHSELDHQGTAAVYAYSFLILDICPIDVRMQHDESAQRYCAQFGLILRSPFKQTVD